MRSLPHFIIASALSIGPAHAALTVSGTPTRFSGTNTYSGSPVSATSASITVPAGALIVVVSNCFESNANSVQSSTASATGLTFTQRAARGSATNGGGASSAGYVAIFTAPDSSGGSRTISTACSHQDNYNGYVISSKVYLVTGQGSTPIGATNAGGPTADSGTGISPTLIASASCPGRVIYGGSEQNGESGSVGAPASSDTADTAYPLSVLGALAAYKAADHTASSSVGGNLDAAAASFWNWSAVEICGDPTISVTCTAPTLNEAGGAASIDHYVFYISENDEDWDVAGGRVYTTENNVCSYDIPEEDVSGWSFMYTWVVAVSPAGAMSMPAALGDKLP